ncbi:GntR family transcriptional regulator [Hydrogenophaga sp. 2FB]|uniref:GntR family transcriptional regulator n=1 Tax=Hydrogenophaga sp. 2FB TaxID=2502187 RepID=UPI0010F95911|nr:GntR family transcriptional regulator [Hydrogenophaga sp. 2FB]
MVLSVKPPPVTVRPAQHSGAGVTQYLQLASILRHQIAHGELVSGQRLPTVLQLAEQYQVAGITVRQAYGLLKTEGLITSDRGRGTYVAEASAAMPARLHAAINDPRATDVRFDVLEQRNGVALPASLARGDAVYDSYACVRKVHVQDGEPFCLAEIYVASEIYKRFPKGSEKRHKMAYLLDGHAKNKMRKMQQTLTVAPADMVLAQALGCSFATPMAHMVRRISDASGRIAYAGLFWYRGDRFVLESEYPFELWLSYPGVAVPQTLD